jgi:hypothetical protein
MESSLNVPANVPSVAADLSVWEQIAPLLRFLRPRECAC